jgi:mono/diheme cytochrome c family protein
MLKSFLLFSAVFLLVFAPKPTLGGMTQDATQAPAAPAAASHGKLTAESRAKVKKLYDVDCAMCHGDNGNGKTDLAKDMQLTLSDWTDPKVMASKQDQDLFDAIRKGKDKMPAEAEGRAPNDVVWNLILYIRGMSKSQPLASAAPAN